MTVKLIRIIMVFLISFLAHRFLNILFEMIKSSFVKKPPDKQPEIETVETEFVEDKDKE